MHPFVYSHRLHTIRRLQRALQKVQAVLGEEDRAQATTVTKTLCETWKIARWRKGSWDRTIGSDGMECSIRISICDCGARHALTGQWTSRGVLNSP
jgi:hypothetical protein